ncbi:MAG: carboxypeptidase-like regulatory domain-containing protein [Acidobacteriia bacterium]|nr:carboxypeptidase-like regulatory domain-containing protein [Terriglobia bacterium]
MKLRGFLVCSAAIFCFLCAGAARAATLRGTVKNATTGAPGAGVEVLLLQLQGGMEEVAHTKSDAQGAFTFDHPSVGVQPMLVRAVYRGVYFHQAVPPGRNVVEVEVFEPTRDAKTLSYPTRVVIFQPNGASLLVGEEYTVQNNSKPPQAYFRADGSFEVQLPEKAELQQISAWGPSAMPVVQATIDRGKNKYAIAYAFRPGENGVRLSYQLPYADNRATVRLPAVYPGDRLLLVAPPGVEVRAEGLQAAGSEQGMNVYTGDTLAPGKAMEIAVSGVSSAPPAPAGGGQESGMPGAAPDGNVPVQMIPGRLDVLKWPLVAGFAALFGLGAIFLVRKPVPAGMPVEFAEGEPARGKKRAKEARLAQAVPAEAPAATSVAEVHSSVATNLEALKDSLFRLELRRQAGTISEEEYARERARTEKILRDIVRG